MSFRYYWISFAVVLGLTLVFSWLRQTRTPRDFFKIMAGVVGGMLLLGLGLAGLAKLLVSLGIAESGFIF